MPRRADPRPFLPARWRALGLRERLLAYLLVFWVLPMLIGAGATLVIQRHEARANAVRRLEALADSRQALVQDWRESALEQAEEIAGLISICSAGPGGQACDLQELLALEAHGIFFSEVSLLDPVTGQVVLSSDPAQEGKVHAGQEYFRSGLTGPSLSPVFYDLALDAPTQVASAPVRDRSGEVVGVVVLRLDVGRLDAGITGHTGLGEAGDVYLVNRDGFLLTAGRYEAGGILRQAIFSEGARRALAGESGWAFYDDYRGVPVLGVYRWLPEAEVALLAEMDRSAVFWEQQVVLVTTLVVGIALLLAGAGSAVFVSRNITRPLGDLVVQAARMAAGDLDARVQVGGGGELERLGRAFNEMATAVQQQFEQLQAIYRLSDAVGRAGTIEEVYAEALDALQRTLKADRAAVLLFDPDGVIRFKAWRGLSEGYRQATEGHSPWEPDERNPQPVLISDVEKEPDLEALRGIILREGIHALGFIPLVYQGRLLGKFMVYYNAPHPFQAEEVQLTQTIARHISFAIARARTEAALRRRAEELAALHAISLEITVPHDLPTLLCTIVQQATRLLDISSGTLFLCDPQREEARCVVSYNTVRDYTGTVLKYGEGATGIVAQTGKPLIIDDYRTWPGRAAVYEEDQPFRAVLSVPLIWQSQVTGVIHMFRDVEPQGFTQADLELLTLFANQAAIAVENARLLEAERAAREQAEAQAAELRARERYMRLLNEITRASVEAADFQTMMQTLADRLGELIDADGCYITLWDEARQMAIPAAAYGELREMYPTVRVEPGEVTMTESVLRAGHVLVAEDVFNTPYLSPRIAAMFPARSLLGLPLIADGQKLGAALIAFNQPHQFTPDEIARGEQAARQIALAIAKAHALEAERQRADELDALRDIIADILTEHELPNLLRTLLERAVALLNATGGDLGLYDEEAQELVIIVSHNMGKDYAGTRMVLGEGAMGQVMQTGKPVLIDDYTTWEQRSPQYADGPWHAVMAAPLISGGRLIGALGIVDSDPRRKFTPSDLRLLGLLADQAAIVVEKARLLKEAQVRARRQAALVRLSADLATTLDEEEICHRVVQQLHDTLGYANQGIFLVDETTGERVCCAYIGWPDAPADWRIPPGQGLTERPLLDGQLHYTPDVTQEPAYVPGLGTGAEVDVPIYVGDKVVGVLVVESQEPNAFGPEDFEVLKAAANQAGIAMSNARLLQISQRRAQEAETLRQAGAVVAATLQQDEAIQRILEQLELVVPYDSASVQLLREGYVEIVGGRGWADPTAVVGLRFPVPGDNPNTVVIQERRPYILNDAPAAHAPFREDPHSHIRSWLGVPLIVGDRVIGMLTVDSKQPGHFTPDHARLITAFANQVAITLENARLFAEVEQRVRELSIMLETARVVSSILHLEEVLPIIARQMAQAIGVSGCTLSRWDREADAVVTWVEWRGDWGEYSSKLGIAYSLKEYPATRAVLEKRHPVVIRVSDPEADPAEVALMREQNILTLLMLPLTIGDRVIGLVELDDEVREREFTSDQIRLSQALADHAAIAIENARLFEAERKHSRELEALHEASLHLTSKLELQSVLEAILNYALKLAAATDAHIFLYDGERLSFGAALWADGREESPYIEPRPEGLTYTVARTGKRIVVDDVNRHSLFKDWPWGGAIAGLPLRIGGQVCGVMNVAFDRPRTFEEDELRVLELLADQAAIAIRNAQLHAEVRALAITDSLTGFYNRRGLFELGRREIERARRFGRPLSAIMLDLDHFKLVNDTYGHHIGDQVLAELAACCRQALRDVDLLGRYGGEEFAFLLPETGVAAAQPVAERLRQHVERSLMNTDRGPISITISLGVAQLDETCPDLETLLERADQALYVAKRSGRNQVRVWQANDQDVP